MSSGRNTVTIYFTVFGGLILAGLVLFAPRQIWSWLLPVLLLAGLAVAGTKVFGRRPVPPPRPEPYRPVIPVESGEQRVVQVPLPSNEEDYDFLFSAVVRWSPLGAAVNESAISREGLAIDAILERARRITEDRHPARAALVQHELNGALGRMQPDDTGCLRAMAESVTLTLSGHDQERLDKMATVRKNRALWEHERKYEQSKREYLGEDVLKDTGSAVVWWLARNDDQVDRTVKDIGALAQLSSAANNTEVPERFRHLVPDPGAARSPDASAAYPDRTGTTGSPREGTSAADHFDAFLRAMDFPEGDPQRALLARQVAERVAEYGRQEVADGLLRRFDPSDAPAPGGFDPSVESPDALPGA
ncbi:hypothetical protein [Planomonospora sp. ID82291]|uniref:hypothetical protein n=1 Tax=Planomonospora sp. ID82291 TaxID=2738136 RepID=UPI0018C3B714|nr:hypothetical protein [Planomonospora sp. ID82291]MBG0817567.1 hypothetical protein [Planomonospora sp. ID82291]